MAITDFDILYDKRITELLAQQHLREAALAELLVLRKELLKDLEKDWDE